MFDPDKAVGSRRGRARGDKGSSARAGNSLLSYSASAAEGKSPPVAAPPEAPPPKTSGKPGFGGWLRGARQRFTGSKPAGEHATRGEEPTSHLAEKDRAAEETANAGSKHAPEAWPEAASRDDIASSEDDRAREDEAYRSYEEERDTYWKPLIAPARVITGIVRARWIIVATTVLGAVAGVLIALATPKQYYAATELLFDPRDLQIIDRELTRGALPSDATLALIENQVSLITSRTVLGNVVDELDLTNDPEFNSQGGSVLGLLLNPRALLSFGGGGGGEATEAIRRSRAINKLAESLRVSRVDRTFVIRIGATTPNPEKSALIASTTANVFLNASSALQAGTAGRANSEITAQLDELRAEVEAAERAVADFKAENDLVDAQGRMISDDDIVRLNEQLSTARARTNELEARAESADALEVNEVLGGALPEQVASPVITELLAQYTAIKQQADGAEARLGPLHPQNRVIEAELAGIREAIAAELRRVVASTRVELQRARSLERDLSSRLAALKAENVTRDSALVTLRELQREAEARRSVYESLLLRARETGQQRFLNTANVSIISPAYAPLLPLGPSRASIAIAGMVLGFILGVLIGAGTGAVASLRENMGNGQGRPLREVRTTPPRRNHDPHPPPPGGGRRVGDRATPAPDVQRPERQSVSGRDIDSAWRAEQKAIDDIRRSLRAFRAEVDALSQERTRRAG